MTPPLLALWTATEPPPLAERDWERLLGQARRARLEVRLANHVIEQGWLAAVPERAQVQLHNARKHGLRLQDELLWEADRIAAALAEFEGPVVVLKGGAYRLIGQAHAEGRLYSDIDLLVPRAGLRAAERALFRAGWIAATLTPYDERYYRDWMHELPPLQHVVRMSSLDLHHTLTPPTSRLPVDAALLLAELEPVPQLPRLSVLSPRDRILHSLVHLLQDGDFSAALRDLLDVRDLLLAQQGEAGFGLRLVARAEQLGLVRPLFHGLVQAEQLFGPLLDAAARTRLAAVAPPRWQAALLRTLLDSAVRPTHPDFDTAFTPWARQALYVRSHWLRMPWHQILPHLARKAWMRARAEPPAPETPAVGAAPPGQT